MKLFTLQEVKQYLRSSVGLKIGNNISRERARDIFGEFNKLFVFKSIHFTTREISSRKKVNWSV